MILFTIHNKIKKMLNNEILKIIGESLKLNKNISVESLRDLFHYIISHKSKFNSAYLTYYILEKFCKTKDIQTRKTSARDFEDFLSAITGGVVTDNSSRHNNKENIFVENPFITEWVVNNKREKADIIYDNGYMITVKTLVEKNDEVNMGAFEKKALFSEMDLVSYLEERKSSNNGIGLGSKPQLLGLLKIIGKKGLWKKFQDRFLEMSKNIFSDDIIMFIKNKENPRIYIISSVVFQNKLKNAVSSPTDFISLINRWEGNNIRMNRTKLVSEIEPIILDFSYLDEHLVKKMDENISKITKNIVLYIEDRENSEIYKKEIIILCNNTLNEIDKEYLNLI